MDNPDNRIRATLLLCSGRRAYDESIQNPYPQKTDRWDEAGQTTAIVGIPNKHPNTQISHYFVLFLIKEDETYLEISVYLLVFLIQPQYFCCLMLKTSLCIVEFPPSELDFTKWQRLVNMITKLFTCQFELAMGFKEFLPLYC